MLVPYIGITGFMSRREAEHILDNMAIGSSRVLMVGVLASSKTLYGLTNKWPNRYPAVWSIRDIFTEYPRALNLIHFNTKQPELLQGQLQRMVELGGEHLNGFQLNIAWPDIKQLESFKGLHPDMHIVLQIGSRAMEAADYDPKEIAVRASQYAHVAEYVLVDPSGGFGKPFSVEFARRTLRELYPRMPDTQMGIAGGLSPETLSELVGPLVEEFPNLCIDAEGRLRTEQDHLDLNACDEYIGASLKLFSGRS